MTSIEASSCVSRSTAMAYTSPLIGALLADCLLGDYWVILLGLLVLYIPGLLMIVLTTVPKLLGNDFPRNTLKFAFLFLWPIGAGTIKSVVNIFGARQVCRYYRSRADHAIFLFCVLLLCSLTLMVSHP